MRMCGKDECWENGKTLTVSFVLDGANPESDCFLDQNPYPEWTDAIKKYAATWEPFANIKFRFVQVLDADIRITLAELPKTSFSCVGIGALSEPTKPSMWLQKSLVGDERGSVIMHEFGHVLGAGHEHQNPNTAIDWDKDAVLVDYIIRRRNIKAENGFDLVQDNATSVGLDSLSQMTPYDPLSIMHYPIPPAYNENKQTPDIPRNYVLSKLDKAWIARYYPHPQHKIGTVDFTGTTTPKDRTVIPRPQPILEGQEEPRLTYGLVSLDVTPKGERSKFRVDNLRAEGEGLSSASLDFLETAPDDPIFQVGTFHAKPNKAENNTLNSPLNQFEYKRPRKPTRPFFEHDPVVIVWISSISAIHTNKTQIKAYTSDITTTGFNLCIKSFGKSEIKSADISWVAYPKDTPGIQTGEIGMSSEVTTNAVQFTDGNFTREAKVLVAVNQIHFASYGRIRFRVAASNITEHGMDLEVGRNIGATYLAIAKIASVRV